MKLLTNKKPNNAAGFSMVEMIGVLAIIAILASLLVPRVFSAMTKAKINGAVMTINTIKAATTEAYSDSGNFTLAGGSPITADDLPLEYDRDVLLPEQLIDKEFSVKIGVETNPADPAERHVVWLARPSAATAGVTADNVAWNFAASDPVDADGDASTDDVGANDVANDQYVVYCYIPNVPIRDARDLSTVLDGEDLSVATLDVEDVIGRVKYAAPVNGETNVLVFIASR